MATPVLFKQIDESNYINLENKDAGTFYLVNKDNGKYDIYCGDQKLNDIDEISEAINKLSKVANTGAAIDISIKDSEDLYTSENVEDAFAEIMKEINSLKDLIDMNIEGTALEFFDDEGLPVLINISEDSDTILLAK